MRIFHQVLRGGPGGLSFCDINHSVSGPFLSFSTLKPGGIHQNETNPYSHEFVYRAFEYGGPGGLSVYIWVIAVGLDIATRF
jgi:hypothetical protein